MSCPVRPYALAATDTALMQLLVGLFASLGSFLFGSVQRSSICHRQRSSPAATISVSLADRSPPLPLSRHFITHQQTRRELDILSACPSTPANSIRLLSQRCRCVSLHRRRFLWRVLRRPSRRLLRPEEDYSLGCFDLHTRWRLTNWRTIIELSICWKG